MLLLRFHNSNTHNGLIFNPEGCSELKKRAYLHLLTACRDLSSSQDSTVPLHLVMSMYNLDTMLGSRYMFHNGNIHDRLIFDPKGCLQSPQNEHVYTYWRSVVTTNQARAWSHYIQSCLHII